jgi:hypothetical protein
MSGKAPKGCPVVEIAVTVKFEGNGLFKLFGVETDLKATVVPTTKPVMSAVTKVVGLVAATQRSEVVAWLGVANRTELAASARTVRIRVVFFI